MAYYDNIAKRWHEATGYKGGAFKELVLNDVLLNKLPGIHHCAILELGAGNGYFMPMVLRRFSGQLPSAITITDQSEQLLELAKRHFRIPDAVYQRVDVAKPFPFADEQFDVVIATMIFNEVHTPAFKNALKECCRVMTRHSLLLITVTHPDFISSLDKRMMLKQGHHGGLTMPGSGSLRLPVVIRPLESYRNCLQEAGLQFDEMEVSATPAVLRIKSGLQNTGNVPLAVVFTCRKKSRDDNAS